MHFQIQIGFPVLFETVRRRDPKMGWGRGKKGKVGGYWLNWQRRGEGRLRPSLYIFLLFILGQKAQNSRSEVRIYTSLLSHRSANSKIYHQLTKFNYIFLFLCSFALCSVSSRFQLRFLSSKNVSFAFILQYILSFIKPSS